MEQQESQVKTPNRDTSTRTPRVSEHHGSSTRSTDQDSPNNQLGDESRNGKRNMRSLKDTRTSRFSEQHGSSTRSTNQDSPNNQSEAIRDENWVQAMDEEIEVIEKNDTWDLVNLQKDKNIIGVKWVYKTKLNEKGEIDRFKARLVAKFLSQQPGVDFGETFALVARLDTIRVVLDTRAQNKWKVYNMDVKSAFLNGILEE
eukprot:PITA_13119